VLPHPALSKGEGSKNAKFSRTIRRKEFRGGRAFRLTLPSPRERVLKDAKFFKSSPLERI
jgi:hypothetical protein